MSDECRIINKLQEELNGLTTWVDVCDPQKDGLYLIMKGLPEVANFSKEHGWTDVNNYPISDNAVKGWCEVPRWEK